jgi:hypothetical protein
MTIGTTAEQAIAHPWPNGKPLTGLAFVGVLGVVLWPSRRRFRLWLATVFLAAGIAGLSGCTQSSTTNTGGDSGTPSGTQLFTVVTSGTDGRTTNRHSLQFQLTVE